MERRERVVAACNAAVGVAGVVALAFALRGDAASSNGSHGDERAVVADRGRFAAPRIVVTSGDVVVFRNDDLEPHSFTAEAGLFDSGVLARGAEYRWSAGDAREVAFHCEIHPRMRAVLVVKAT